VHLLPEVFEVLLDLLALSILFPLLTRGDVKAGTCTATRVASV
jgi:hypothetical protein